VVLAGIVGGKTSSLAQTWRIVSPSFRKTFSIGSSQVLPSAWPRSARIAGVSAAVLP